MAIHYKFKSAKDYDSLSIEGHFISIASLKEKIVEKMKLGRASDFDLLISNAQTNEEYDDEGFLVPKNTSVLVRRVPGKPRLPIVTEAPKEPELLLDEHETTQKRSEFDAAPSSQRNHNDWADDFGVDLYEEPEILQPQVAQSQPSINRVEEETKIKAFLDASNSDWQRQTQEASAGGRGFGRGGQMRPGGGRGYGQPFLKKTPPAGYVCHRCGVAGHYIQHCPTNGDPTYNMKKVKLPTGIPKTMLVANPDGSYALPNGEVAVLKPNEAVFEKEMDVPVFAHRPASDVPAEFRCPLCRGVMRDAVLTSKCCFNSYCDQCIREEIIKKSRCVCGASNVLADDLLPNKTLREAILRTLYSITTTSSAENAGSRVLQDLESSRPPAKAGSPTTSLKEAHSGLCPADSSTLVISEGRPQEVAVENTVPEVADTTKEQIANSRANSIPGEEVSLPQTTNQPAKRMKAKRGRSANGTNMYPGHQMQWRGMPRQVMGEGQMMAYGSGLGYNGYWPPQHMGDGYMYAYGGASGYACEMPYNMPMMSHDGYAPQPMMPAGPQFNREFMEYNYGADYGYGGGRPNDGILSREEFEAKKAEARRKIEKQQRDQSDYMVCDGTADDLQVGMDEQPKGLKADLEPYQESNSAGKAKRLKCVDRSSCERKDDSKRSQRSGYDNDPEGTSHHKSFRGGLSLSNAECTSSGDDSMEEHHGKRKHKASSKHSNALKHVKSESPVNQRIKSGGQTGGSTSSLNGCKEKLDSSQIRSVTNKDSSRASEGFEGHETPDQNGRSHSQSSNKRVSVFLRVKPRKDEYGDVDEDGDMRSRSKKAKGGHIAERTQHDLQDHNDHEEKRERHGKSVFNRISFDDKVNNPKTSHQKLRSEKSGDEIGFKQSNSNPKSRVIRLSRE